MAIFPLKVTQKDDSLHRYTTGVIIVIWNSLMCFGDESRGSPQRVNRMSTSLVLLSHLSVRAA